MWVLGLGLRSCFMGRLMSMEYICHHYQLLLVICYQLLGCITFCPLCRRNATNRLINQKPT